MTYDVEHFYTDSTDKQGHRDTIRLSLPPGVLPITGAIVASKIIPEYRTSADLIRDSIHHRLHWIEKMFDPAIVADRVEMMVAISEAESEKRRRKEADDLVETLTSLAWDAKGSAKETSSVRDQIIGALSLTDIHDGARERLETLLDRLA